jgi:hypothetical protein
MSLDMQGSQNAQILSTLNESMLLNYLLIDYKLCRQRIRFLYNITNYYE